MASGFVGVLTCELHFPEAHSLKEKRHYVRSAKAQLQHRVGASVAAQTGMIGPLSTILMSVIILGEPFTGWIVAGTVLVMDLVDHARAARRKSAEKA